MDLKTQSKVPSSIIDCSESVHLNSGCLVFLLVFWFFFTECPGTIILWCTDSICGCNSIVCVVLLSSFLFTRFCGRVNVLVQK